MSNTYPCDRMIIGQGILKFYFDTLNNIIPCLRKGEEMLTKVYVDVDETLVFWENPNNPYFGNLTVNHDLIEVLKKGLDKNLFKVCIWSYGGKKYAEMIAKTIFKDYKLPFYSKETYYKVPDNCIAVDDREQKDRYYLEKFAKVFSPTQFVDYIDEKLRELDKG